MNLPAFFTSKLTSITILLVVLCMSATAQWSEKDKKMFRREMNKVKALSSYGKQKNKFIECYLEKCEATYSSFEEADNDEEGAKNLALACGNELFSNGSVLGNWSAIDKSKFRKDMKGVKELSRFGKNKDQWIECYLSKCEETYHSYFEANSDEEGVTSLAAECTTMYTPD